MKNLLRYRETFTKKLEIYLCTYIKDNHRKKKERKNKTKFSTLIRKQKHKQRKKIVFY